MHRMWRYARMTALAMMIILAALPLAAQTPINDAQQQWQQLNAQVVEAYQAGSARVALASFPVMAWDGYDYENGTYVEIERGNLVRPGRDIEFYDWSTGEYRTGTIDSMRSIGNGVEIEVFDDITGELRTFDMD